jgi:hypothetical protein
MKSGKDAFAALLFAFWFLANAGQSAMASAEPFKIVRSLPISEPTWGAKCGDLYLVAAERSMLVYRKTGPAPADYQQVGMAYPGHDTDIKNARIDGDLIYFGAKSEGVVAYRIADLETFHAKPVMQAKLDNGVKWIAIDGDRVIAGLYEGGLAILDKETLKVLGKGLDDIQFLKFDAQGGFVYASEATRPLNMGNLPSLFCIDASDPAGIKIVQTLIDREQPTVYDTPVIGGGRLYVSEYNGGVGVYDLSIPGSMSLLYRYQNVGGHIGGAGHRHEVEPRRIGSIDVDGQYGYVAFDQTVESVKIGRDGMQRLATVCAVKKNGGGLLDPSAVFINQNTLAIPTTMEGIRFYDVSDPANPKLDLNIDLPSRFEGIAKVGRMVYSSNDIDGVWQADWDAPEGPRIRKRIPLKGLSEDLVLYKDHLYVANGLGLGVIDVSDEDNPREVYYWDFPYDGPSSINQGWVEGVCESEGLLYVAALKGGLHIFDLADPAKPELISVTVIPGTAGHDVFVEPKRNLAAWGGTQKLAILDVSDPANPNILSTVKKEGASVSGAFFSPDGNYVISGENQQFPSGGQFTVYDIKDPSNPVELNTYPLGGGSEGGLIYKDYLLMAGRGGGVNIYRIGDNLEDLQYVQNIPSYFYNSKFFVEGERIFTNCQGIHELKLVSE